MINIVVEGSTSVGKSTLIKKIKGIYGYWIYVKFFRHIFLNNLNTKLVL